MFGATLSACDRGKQWPVALAVLEQMEEEEVAPGQIACNSLVPRRPMEAWSLSWYWKMLFR